MTDSLDKMNETFEEIQQNVSKATIIAKNIPEKVKLLLKDKEELEQRVEALINTKSELENKISQISNTLLEKKAEFDEMIKSNENRIVSLQRELDLAKDDVKKLDEQIKSRNEKIKMLESKNQELSDALRQKSL